MNWGLVEKISEKNHLAGISAKYKPTDKFWKVINVEPKTRVDYDAVRRVLEGEYSPENMRNGTIKDLIALTEDPAHGDHSVGQCRWSSSCATHRWTFQLENHPGLHSHQ